MGNEVYWRNSGRHPRLLFVDARVIYAILPVLFHLRLWTLCLALLAMLGFWIVECFGMTPGVALRALSLYLLTGGYRWCHIGSYHTLNRRHF